jgi:hypothetical protein
MSNKSLMKKVLNVIPPFLMLFGVIFMSSGVSGIFNNVLATNTKVVMCSIFFVTGLVASTFSYLIIHDKIGIAKYFRSN